MHGCPPRYCVWCLETPSLSTCLYSSTRNNSNIYIGIILGIIQIFNLGDGTMSARGSHLSGGSSLPGLLRMMALPTSGLSRLAPGGRRVGLRGSCPCAVAHTLVRTRWGAPPPGAPLPASLRYGPPSLRDVSPLPLSPCLGHGDGGGDVAAPTIDDDDSPDTPLLPLADLDSCDSACHPHAQRAASADGSSSVT